MIDDNTLDRLCEALRVRSDLAQKKKLTSVMNRLKFLNMLVPCTRCSGTGNYSYNSISGTVCFMCNGFKCKLPEMLDQSYIDKASELTEQGELIPYLEELKKNEKIKKANKSISDLIWNSNISQDYVTEVKKSRSNVDPLVDAYRQKLTNISKPFYDKQHEYDVMESRYKLGKVNKEEIDEVRDTLYDIYLRVEREIKLECVLYEEEKRKRKDVKS